MLVNLAIKRAALRRRGAENGEEAGTLTTNTPRLRHEPIDFELLTIDHVFRAPNLVGAGWIRVALVKRRELRLKPLASGICGLRIGRRQAE
ncbi:MAG TPA: hypothetical protein VFL68_06680 [Pseudolabrys sp.]|nr:hypothetical protein [Pseudolabrys sp.]